MASDGCGSKSARRNVRATRVQPAKGLSNYRLQRELGEACVASRKRIGGTIMDVAYISALSALAGSVIGGMTSGITTWLNQRAQLRSNQIAHDQSRREELYKEFILAASNTYGEAITTNEPHIPEIISLYAMVSRMRAFSLPRTVACAERVMIVTIETYALPNQTIPELSELIKDGTGVDPLKDFAEAVRAELGRI
jgi:hypothetical protein